MKGKQYGEKSPCNTENWVFSPNENMRLYLLKPENIISQDQTLPTSVSEVYLWVRVIKPVLRGKANWEPVSLLHPQKMLTVKQYTFLGGHKEIGETT